MNTINLTDGQLEYLQELVMFAYEMEVPEQKGWDVQTYDNLVDEVMKWWIMNSRRIAMRSSYRNLIIGEISITSYLVKMVSRQKKTTPCNIWALPSYTS